MEQWPSAAIGIWEADSRLLSIALSPDGTRIVSSSNDKAIRVWDARTGDAVAGPFKGTQLHSLPMARSSSLAPMIKPSEYGMHALGPFKGHTGSVSSVAFSPDGTRIVSGSHDQTIRVWDARTGDSAGPFKMHTGSVTSVAFSPDGTHIASGSNDQTIRVCDARTGDTVAEPFKGLTSWVTPITFSPDGTRIVSGSHDQTIRVWDSRTGDSENDISINASLLPHLHGDVPSVDNFTFEQNGWITADNVFFFWISLS